MNFGKVLTTVVRGETSEKIFAETLTVQGPGGLEIPVPRPEHLAALKVMAMKNDPARSFQEMADIRFLLTLSGVDRQEVRAYFERHGLEVLQLLYDQMPRRCRSSRGGRPSRERSRSSSEVRG